MAKKKNSQQRRQHSFYKEARKSFSGEGEFSYAKLWKQTKKYLKWGIFGFLITATIWGCVNQFRNPTSPNVTQGLEFYENDHDVWPNMYASETSFTYSNYVSDYGNQAGEKIFRTQTDYQIWDGSPTNTKTNNEYTGHVGGGDGADLAPVGALVPLNFYTFNPNFWLNSESGPNYGTELTDQEKYATDYGPDTNTNDPLIPISDLTTDVGRPAPKSYSYQATLQDIYGFFYEIVLVDWENAANLMTGEYYAPLTTLPMGLNYYLNLTTDQEEWDEINSWSRYLWYAQENLGWTAPQPQGNDIWEVDEDEPDGIKKDSEGYGILDLDDYSVVYNGPADDYINFDVNNIITIEKINTSYSGAWNDLTGDEKADVLIQQTMLSMNTYLFNNPDIVTVNQNTLVTTTDGTTETFDQIYQGALNDENISTTVTLDYETNLPPPLEDVANQTGTQVYLYGQSQGNPIVPTEETLVNSKQYMINAISSLGGYSTWEDLPTNNGTGRDHTTDNMGWTVVDSDGDILTLDDGTPLWSITRTADSGAFVNDDTQLDGIQITNNNSDYVMDELIKNKINDGTTLTTETVFSIGVGGNQTSYDYNMTNEFGGVMNITELGYLNGQPNYVPPFDQRGGKAQAIDWVKKDGSNKIFTAEESNSWNGSQYYTGSKMESSIEAEGESPTNSTRIVFSGWEDWGEAWDVNFGPMYGLFVFPVAMISLEVVSWMPYYSGWGAWGVLLGMILIVFAFRFLGSLMTWKSQDSQHKMQETQTEVAQIKAKYAQYDLKENKKMKQKQQQEIMALYKKKGVNPFKSFGTLFLTLPIFLSMWTLISSLAVYKIAEIGIFSFAVSPFFGMFNISQMFMLYLLIGGLVGMSQAVSSKLPTWLADKRSGNYKVDEATKAARKKANRTQNIMIGVFVFIGLTIQTLLAFYWIFSALYSILFELYRHNSKLKKAKQTVEQK